MKLDALALPLVAEKRWQRLGIIRDVWGVASGAGAAEGECVLQGES
jgi:hypothetical protein